MNREDVFKGCWSGSYKYFMVKVCESRCSRLRTKLQNKTMGEKHPHF